LSQDPEGDAYQRRAYRHVRRLFELSQIVRSEISIKQTSRAAQCPPPPPALTPSVAMSTFTPGPIVDEIETRLM
jgi:hypothetical protein